MAATYYFKLKNQSGVVVHQSNVWRTLNYTKRVNGLHSVTLQVPYDHPVVPFYELDSQIEVYRRDAEKGLDWYLDFEGMFRTPVSQLFENGRETFTMYGFGYNDLLARRGIWYPSGSAFTEKADVAETVMKEFVDENAGPSANHVDRKGGSGVTQGLSIELDLGGGAVWTGARAYRNLYSVLEEIAQDTNTFFDTVGVGDGLFMFQFYPNQRGTDRSTVGLDPTTGLNAAGNAPVVFAAEFGNLLTLAHSVNRSEEFTVVLALGQGIEEDREDFVASDAVAEVASPWNRRELSYNANQETTQAGLESVANAQLMARAQKIGFNFTPLFAGATVLGRDYDWGDVITARYRGDDFHLGIVSKTVTVDSGGENVAFEVNSVT